MGGNKGYFKDTTAREQIGTRIKCGVVETSSESFSAGLHTNRVISISLPSTTVAVLVMKTPNDAWIFANTISFSATEVRLGVYNTAADTVSGTFKLVYFYT